MKNDDGIGVLERVFGHHLPENGNTVKLLNDVEFMANEGVLRSFSCMENEDSLSRFYEEHWNHAVYNHTEALQFERHLFDTQFPDHRSLFTKIRDDDVILDIGCGSGIAGRTFFGDIIQRTRYVAIDMSYAIEKAKKDFSESGCKVGLMQCTIEEIPFAANTADIIFCPGVLHYTPSVAASLRQLARLLKPGGKLIAWIYKKQPPLRALTDDYLRSIFSKLDPHAAFEAMQPLTKLGIALGRLHQKITIEEDIDCLGIPRGQYGLHELFYYYIIKLFFRQGMSFERHNLNNWNAYCPAPVHFHAPDEILKMTTDAGFQIGSWNEKGNGIGIIATRVDR